MVSKQITKEVRTFLTQSEYPFANKVVVSKAGVWTATKDISDIRDGAAFYTRATNDFTYGETIAAELAQQFSVTVEVLENTRDESTWTTKFTLTEVEQPVETSAEPAIEPDAATVNGSQPDASEEEFAPAAIDAVKPEGIALPEWVTFLVECEIATDVQAIESGWQLTNDVTATNLDFEWASNPDALGTQVKQVLESRFPLTVDILSCDSDGQAWAIQFQTTATDRLPSHNPWTVFQQLAEQFNGDPDTGNFGGTLRVEEEGEVVEMLAIYYYDVVKSFCTTCSCSFRPLKAGGSSIRIVAGQRRSTAIVKRQDQSIALQQDAEPSDQSIAA